MSDLSKRKLRICIFNWRDPLNPKSGGAERVTLEHALYWAKRGHQVTWISGSHQGSKEYELREGIHFYCLGSSNTLFLRAASIYWFKFHGEFDVVIDEVHGIPAFSPLWAWKSKKIAFIHEVAGEIWDQMFSFPVSTIGKLIESTLFPLVYRSTQFWVDSSSTKIDLENLGIPVEHIQVIPCAIHPHALQRVPKEKVLTCVFLARLVKMKGIETALKVFQHIHSLEASAQLWIVGTGEPEYVTELHALVKKMSLEGQVTFYGQVSEEEKYSLLAKAHFLLHTSVKEGFGLTVLEAASQKTPALVFDVPSLRDIVVDDQTGVVASCNDMTGLASETVQLYKNQTKYKLMSELAYEYGQKYKWSVFTQQSLELLEK